jgi:hypothetical protein
MSRIRCSFLGKTDVIRSSHAASSEGGTSTANTMDMIPTLQSPSPNKSVQTAPSVTKVKFNRTEVAEASLEDIQRHTRSLWRKTESTTTFFTKAQPEIYSKGGRSISDLPDLLEEVIKEVDALNGMARGFLEEMDEHEAFVSSIDSS